MKRTSPMVHRRLLELLAAVLCR